MAIANPTVTINNVPYLIVPNSFKFVEGLGETNVRAASAGGGSVVPVHTENAEGKIGKVMFDMYVTDEALDMHRTTKGLTGQNVVSGTEVGNKAVTLTLASNVTDPEFEASADGIVSFEFHGAPLAAN